MSSGSTSRLQPCDVRGQNQPPGQEVQGLASEAIPALGVGRFWLLFLCCVTLGKVISFSGVPSVNSGWGKVEG